jgi:hypothetical protein
MPWFLCLWSQLNYSSQEEDDEDVDMAGTDDDKDKDKSDDEDDEDDDTPLTKSTLKKLLLEVLVAKRGGSRRGGSRRDSTKRQSRLPKEVTEVDEEKRNDEKWQRSGFLVGVPVDTVVPIEADKNPEAGNSNYAREICG